MATLAANDGSREAPECFSADPSFFESRGPDGARSKMAAWLKKAEKSECGIQGILMTTMAKLAMSSSEKMAIVHASSMKRRA